jgi:hypothetical protein
MSKRRDKTTAISIALVLILATSVLLISIPFAHAKTTLTLSTTFYSRIGQNSATQIVFKISPNVFLTDPAYEGKTSIWANATVTFTRPDSTTDVVNGPITLEPAVVGGVDPRLSIIYTPDVMGAWSVNFYWPGDDVYNSINRTSTFTVKEHFPRRQTFAMLSIKPYPTVGLGQDILINAWITPAPLIMGEIYQGYVFTFTRPDGTRFTVGPMDSEGPACVWFNLPLDQLGNWSIKFEWPGDFGDLPASVTRYVTVQDEWVTVGYPDTPLPTEPWTFPINVENREWRTIAGPWYMQYYNDTRGSWNPYTEAPRTAHILWKLPAYSGLGGYIGSPHSIETGGGEEAYGAGDAGIYSSSVPNIRTVMAGRGYYSAGGMIHCVDMRTGEELWSVEGSFNVGTSRGRTAALYSFSSTRFVAYDAITGAQILDVPGMSSSRWLDPYVLTSSGGRLIKWDTSGTSTNFASRIVFNVSLPQSPGTYSSTVSNLWVTTSTDYIFAYNLTTGELEYNHTISNFADPDTWIYREGPHEGAGYGLTYYSAVPTENEGLGYVAFDAINGKVAWVSEKTDYPWGNFWHYMPIPSAYNMIYAGGYSGVYAFNVTNGKIVWHYIDPDTCNEQPYASDIAPDGSDYASYSFGSTGSVVGGGVVFAPNTEHSPTFIYRGQGLNAIDAFTGERIWRILGTYVPTAIAYGVLLATDSYNGYTYAFAKGETATTVAASSKVIGKGDSVLLEGTVLDMSPAQPGTAAVADKDQEAWMEYLHMQQPYPFSAQGVAVSLDALDPNNNFVHIGDATTDLTGQYRLGWEPEIEGQYTVIASFYSTEAYYGSTAETGILVTVPAPTATASGEQIVTVDTMPIVYAIIGVGVVIVIAIAAAIMLLRKRQ